MTLDLPDLPRWVEAHGIASDPDHWRRPLGTHGFALGHDAAKLIVLIGDPDPAATAELPTSHTLLFAIEHAHLTRLRPSTRAILHTLSTDPPDYEGATLLPPDAPLPDHLASELTWARSRGPVFTVYVDNAPSAFAYAPWCSPTLFDISVDTLPTARQLGLGTIVASALIQHHKPLQPVWGADEDNTASLRLAQRLGFSPVDELWVAPAP